MLALLIVAGSENFHATKHNSNCAPNFQMIYISLDGNNSALLSHLFEQESTGKGPFSHPRCQI